MACRPSAGLAASEVPARALAALALAAALAAALRAAAARRCAQRAPGTFAPLARQLLPAVVNIPTTQAVAGARAGRPDAPDVPQAPPGSPFEEFFRDFFNRNRPPGQQGQPASPARTGPQQRPQRRAQSLGSGFIIDAAGIVVTNNHVIEGADEINVILQDNTTIRARAAGHRPAHRHRRAAHRHRQAADRRALGRLATTAQVGDWVIAIGNPFGLGGTVTAGIVSARGRDIRQGLYDDFIQTDAAINRGNSGGPLFNMDGEVVGINTAIYSPSGGSIGIGFSIPSNLAQQHRGAAARWRAGAARLARREHPAGDGRDRREPAACPAARAARWWRARRKTARRPRAASAPAT